MPRRITAAVVCAALLTALLPAIHVAARGPVKVRGEEVSTSVEGQRLIPLPFDASHVALRWTGSDADHLSIAFGLRPNDLGEEVPVAIDHDATGEPGEVFSGVIWTGGARFARVTSGRKIASLKVLAMDARDDNALAAWLGADDAGGGSVANAAMTMPSIISRAGWNANEEYRFDSGGYERFPPHFDPLQKVIVHHTAGRNDDPDPEATIRAIYYVQAVNRGYGDMDYNYMIDWQGRIYEGRHSRDYASGEPITGEDLAGNVVRAAHASGYNDATVGIALLGNFVDVMPPTAQRSALEKLIAWKLERHGINPLGASTYVNPRLGTTKYLNNISGHRDVNATACPGGTFYAWFPTLRQNVANRIAATTGSSVDHTAPEVLSLLPTTPTTTGATTIPFGLVLKEPVTGLTAGDFDVGGTSPGWTVASITGKASTYTVTVVAPDGGGLPDEGTVRLTLETESVQDLGGNLGPISPAVGNVTYAHDDDAPTVILWQMPHRSASDAEFFDWTATFSEPVLGFEIEDVVLGGPDADEWQTGTLYGSGRSFAWTTSQPSLSNGTFTVSIPAGAATDLAGNPLVASKVVTLTADRSNPSTTTPTVSLRSGTTLNDGKLRVRVSWTGTDSGPAGISTYDVRRSYDGAAFETIGTGVTDSHLDWSISPGHTYRFEVRARDKAGNIGAWTASATLKPALTQQSSSAVTWSGTSTTTSSTNYSGGTQRHLAAAGSSASYTTSARSLSFITTRSPIRGSARIYIDGALAATVDLNSPTATYQFVAFSKSWSSVGTHTIKVVSVGTPVARVDVDAFGVIR